MILFVCEIWFLTVGEQDKLRTFENKVQSAEENTST